MFTLLIHFTYLQLLDILTTLAFLTIGVQEANPLIRFLLGATHSPLGALLAVKLLALALACYCWRSGKRRLLFRVNVFYAALVAWNLVAFLLGGAGAAAV